ncbi:hypothetical protein RCL1_002091 [Eukaryota sp. TZLM3-RCL]
MEEVEARIGSLFTSFMGLTWLLNFFVLENDLLSYIPVVMFADFFIRFSVSPLFSPFGVIAKVLSYAFKPHPCSTVPKRRAYFVGSLFTAIASFSVYFSQPIIALVCVGMLTIFSFAEGAFSFCVLCIFIKAIVQYRLKRKLARMYGIISTEAGNHPAKNLVDKTPNSAAYQYDIIFLGGGSGGLAGAQEAVKYGARTAVVEYYPSYGIGGTCSLRGCIPKIQIHEAAAIARSNRSEYCSKFGFEANNCFDWSRLIASVQGNVEKNSAHYNEKLPNAGINVYTGTASFVDPHTIRIENANDNSAQTITGHRIVIAVGGRPTRPSFTGAEHVITSDELFRLPSLPSEIIVVGAGYIALESAGFLAELGAKVTVLVRSKPLRNADKDVVERIVAGFEELGVNMVEKAEIQSITRDGDRLTVTHSSRSGLVTTTVDCVLVATGRTPNTDMLKLENAGVVMERNGKLKCVNERTNVDHIYAIGDVVYGAPELTPVAIKAGKLLVKRLFNQSQETMSYVNIATTMFLAPNEYASVGLTEERAIEVFGKENVNVYTSQWTPAYWAFVENYSCWCKIIVNSLDDVVVGIHLLAPRAAAEVMQGFAAFVKNKGTKKMLDSTVMIHPSQAEYICACDTLKAAAVVKTSC